MSTSESDAHEQEQPHQLGQTTKTRRKTLRYSVVFSPTATSDSLRMTYAPLKTLSSSIQDDDDDDNNNNNNNGDASGAGTGSSDKKPLSSASPSLWEHVQHFVWSLLLHLVNYMILIPLAYTWKLVTGILLTLGIVSKDKCRGATIVMTLLSVFFFRPMHWFLSTTELILNKTLGVSLDGPMFRNLVAMAFNGFGFAWHAFMDTLTTPPASWKLALDRFQTFLEENGLDLEMQLALGPKFLDNMMVYDDVQKLLGLDIDNRISETKLRTTPDNNNVTNDIPSFEEASHFMHYATAAYGAAVIVGTLFECCDSDGVDRLKRCGGRNDGCNDERQVLAYLKSTQDDLVVSHLTTGGSMDILRHFVIVDHKTKSLIFAIRGTFSISGIISDWVSFSAPFCGGVGHVAMSEVATKMWDLTKEEVLAKLEELPDDYQLVITGHSLGAGVATLLTILLYHEKEKNADKCDARLKKCKIRCFAFAPPPTFYPLSAAPQAVAATTAYIHGDDTVPFLSVYHLRRFFKSMSALKQATRHFSTWQFLRIDWGYDDPTQEMVDAVRKAEEQELRHVKGSERVAIPAKAVVWLQPTNNSKNQQSSSSSSSDSAETAAAAGTTVQFDAHICDANKLAQLPIRVPGSQRHMLAHHLASKYEIALQNVVQQKQKQQQQQRQPPVKKDKDQ